MTDAVSVVLPAYNEASHLRSAIAQIVDGLTARNRTFEIIVVENGSRDDTSQIARDLAATESRLRVTNLEKPNIGKALKTGILAARYPLILILSVDVVDLQFFDRASSLIARYAGVLGSKAVTPAEDRRPWPKRIGSSVFHYLARILLRLHTRDTHGIKLFRKEQVVPLVSLCRSEHEVFDDELIFRAERAGFLMCEIPFIAREVRPSRVHSFRRGARALYQVLLLRISLWLELVRLRRRPGHD